MRLLLKHYYWGCYILHYVSSGAGDAPSPWQGHGDEGGTCRQLFPWGLSGDPVRPFLTPVLLLLGFLLIWGNIIYSNKVSLEKPKPFWKCSWLLWLRTRPWTSSRKRKGHRYSLAACLKDYNVLEWKRAEIFRFRSRYTALVYLLLGWKGFHYCYFLAAICSLFPFL